MTNTHPRTEQLDALVNDYLDAKAAADKHATRAREKADEIVRLIPEGHQYKVDGGGVTITKPRATFDATLAAEVLDDVELAAITDTIPARKVVSSDLAKRFLSPARLEQVKRTTGRPSVREL